MRVGIVITGTAILIIGIIGLIIMLVPWLYPISINEISESYSQGEFKDYDEGDTIIIKGKISKEVNNFGWGLSKNLYKLDYEDEIQIFSYDDIGDVDDEVTLEVKVWGRDGHEVLKIEKTKMPDTYYIWISIAIIGIIIMIIGFSLKKIDLEKKIPATFQSIYETGIRKDRRSTGKKRIKRKSTLFEKYTEREMKEIEKKLEYIVSKEKVEYQINPKMGLELKQKISATLFSLALLSIILLSLISFLFPTNNYIWFFSFILMGLGAIITGIGVQLIKRCKFPFILFILFYISGIVLGAVWNAWVFFSISILFIILIILFILNKPMKKDKGPSLEKNFFQSYKKNNRGFILLKKDWKWGLPLIMIIVIAIVYGMFSAIFLFGFGFILLIPLLLYIFIYFLYKGRKRFGLPMKLNGPGGNIIQYFSIFFLIALFFDILLTDILPDVSIMSRGIVGFGISIQSCHLILYYLPFVIFQARNERKILEFIHKNPKDIYDLNKMSKVTYIKRVNIKFIIWNFFRRKWIVGKIENHKFYKNYLPGDDHKSPISLESLKENIIGKSCERAQLEMKFWHSPKSIKRLWSKFNILLLIGFPLMILLQIIDIYNFNPFPYSCILFLFIGVIIVCTYGVAIIISMCFIYIGWKIIQDGNPRLSLHKTIAYMFIPFFNIYGYFIASYGLAVDMNKYMKEKRISKQYINERLAFILGILFVILLLIELLPGFWINLLLKWLNFEPSVFLFLNNIIDKISPFSTLCLGILLYLVFNQIFSAAFKICRYKSRQADLEMKEKRKVSRTEKKPF